jgi:hypothetical protein
MEVAAVINRRQFLSNKKAKLSKKRLFLRCKYKLLPVFSKYAAGI